MLTFKIIFFVIFIYFLASWVTNRWMPTLSKHENRKQLLRIISELIIDREALKKTNKNQIPLYKFYSELLHTSLLWSFEWGAPLKENLKELRACLIQDDQFERKLRKLVQETWVQVALMVVVIWGFVLAAQKISDLRPNDIDLFVMALWQSLGMIFFFLVYNHKKNKTFKIYGMFIKPLTFSKCLSGLGLSINEIIKKSDAELVLQSHESKLKEIKGQFREILYAAMEHGHNMKQPLSECLEELYFLLEQDFEAFLGLTRVIKFMTLTLFFFPTYLYFMYALFSNAINL